MPLLGMQLTDYVLLQRSPPQRVQEFKQSQAAGFCLDAAQGQNGRFCNAGQAVSVDAGFNRLEHCWIISPLQHFDACNHDIRANVIKERLNELHKSARSQAPAAEGQQG